MVAGHPVSNSTIRLQSDSFAITGVLSTQPEWYEFEVIINGATFGNVGSQAKDTFIEEILPILEQKNRRELSSIPGAAFKDIVGGDSAEYLGYVALSGYNTFYFFKDKLHLIHVVLADGEGKMLAHSQFDAQVFNVWHQQITAWNAW